MLGAWRAAGDSCVAPAARPGPGPNPEAEWFAGGTVSTSLNLYPIGYFLCHRKMLDNSRKLTAAVGDQET